MRNFVSLLLIFVVGSAMFFFLTKTPPKKGQGLPIEAPVPSAMISPAVSTKTQISAWLPWWEEKRALESLRRAKGKLVTILPVWYGLGEDGKVSEIPSNFKPEVLSFAKEVNTAVLPSISNAKASGFDPERVSLLINDEELKEEEIGKLVNLAKTNHFSGWDLDWEEIYEKDRQTYSEFTNNFADELHKNGLLLSVTVHAQEGTPDDWAGTKGQDLEELSKSADFVRIMAYDFNNSQTPPGPVTPIDKLKSTLAYAVKIIPTHKIVLGLPTYGYDWDENAALAIQYQDAYVLLEKYGTKGIRDKESFALTGGYVSFGVKHTLWFEDAESLKKKIEIAQKYGVYQFSLWHLGGEDPEIWDLAY